jgi:hypothetical protein
MTTNQSALNATGGSEKVRQHLQTYNGIMQDSEFHLYYLEGSSGSATIQPSKGSEIELGVVAKIANVSWLIGWIDVFHDPFEVEQTLQVTDISDRLRNQNFVQIHLKELIYDGKIPMPSFDPLHTTVRLNRYYAAFFNTGETSSSKTWHIKSMPDQKSWNFLRNQSSVEHVGVYAELSLLSVTTDYENIAWQNLMHGARTDLIRLIEVWHQSLSRLNAKTLLSKLERATNQQRQSLVGIFGAWNNSGFAKKTNDRWEFDVPKILANYKLTPLHPDAISEFKRRGQEFKEQHET